MYAIRSYYGGDGLEQDRRLGGAEGLAGAGLLQAEDAEDVAGLDAIDASYNFV